MGHIIRKSGGDCSICNHGRTIIRVTTKFVRGHGESWDQFFDICSDCCIKLYKLAKEHATKPFNDAEEE